MMDTLPRSPSRISERRGKPELLLESQAQMLLPPVQATRRNGTSTNSSISSIASGLYPASDFDTPAMSVPVTPTDATIPPQTIKSMASPFGGSSIVGSIREEEETGSYDCDEYEGYPVDGLGLNMMALDKELDMGMASLGSTQTSRFFDEPMPLGTERYYNDEKLAPVTMPPTPPSQSELYLPDDDVAWAYDETVGEHPYAFGLQISPTAQTIDADAFTSQPPPVLLPPQSPPSSTSSRAAIILNKVVPSKLRASLKRRLSSPNQHTNTPPPPPPISTMPRYISASVPGTPPGDTNDFGGFLVKTPSSAPTEEPLSLSAPESVLPPMAQALLSAPPGPDPYHTSPRNSPGATNGLSYLTIDTFPDSSLPSPNSPLHPSSVRSPLVSPSIASASQSSLPISTSVSPHKKAPSIDPATPLAPKRPSIPLSLMTANTLADMIEEMHSDLAAYDATHTRMVQSGWSSPQEIKNVELQREDKERMWKARIEESKKVLEGMRRCEAAKSVESLHSAISITGRHVTEEPLPF